MSPPAAPACPDPAALEQFLLGRLAGPSADSLDDHLAGCPACADRLAGLPAEDDLVTGLRRPSAVLNAVPQSQVESVLARLRDTPPPGPEPTGDDPDFLDPPAGPGELGRVGPYRVRRELGRGGMGVVYEAEDTRLRRRVALKLVRDGRLGDPHYRARFDREADALARLQHPNIVPVYEAGRHRGRPYLALEYVPGGTLADHLKGRPQPVATAAALTATLAEAVAYAHGHGIVHRDLKPGNVLLIGAIGPMGPIGPIPKIADFGLARHLDEAGLTLSGDLLGTPGYMAPEMTRGGQAGAKDSPAVDVYSLGAILYECLTGRPPFRGESVPDTLEQVRLLDPVPPRRLQPRVPRDLETVCLKCLEKEPARRYGSAAALAEDLRRFLAGRPVTARPAGPLRRLAKWARRKPAWATLAAVSVVAVVVVAVVAVRYERHLRKARDAAEASAADARREREAARKNYREARAALQKMLARVADPRRGDLPRVRELRKDQQEDALAFYLVIAAQDPDPDPEVRWDVAQARLQASLMQIHLGRGPEARDNLIRATNLLRALTAEYPDDRRYRRSLAESLTQRGYISSGDEARQLLREALGEVEALLAADPAAEDYRNDLARLCHALGQKAYDAGALDEAERYYLRGIDVRRGLLADHPNWAAQQRDLGTTLVNLLLLRQTAKRPVSELAPLADEATAVLRAAADADPGDQGSLIPLAALRSNWAYTQMARGENAAAAADLGGPINRLEAFVAREPDWAEARRVLLNAHGTRALAYDRQGKYAEAAADYRRVVDLSATPAARQSYRIDLAGLLLHARDPAAAADETDRTAADPTPPANPLNFQRLLMTCSILSRTTGKWGWRPYHDRAVRAAVAVIGHTRRALPPDQWANWLAAARKNPDSAPILGDPDVQAALR